MNTGDRNKPCIHAAVRELAESTRRRGGFSSALFAGLSGAEGTRIHQIFEKNAPALFPGSQLFPEEPLTGFFSSDDYAFVLNIQGRCDLIAISPAGAVTLLEVKGFRGNVRSIPVEGDDAHWAQAMLYAYLLLGHPLIKERGRTCRDIRVEIHYVSFDSRDSIVLSKDFTADALSSFFDETCRVYLETAVPLFEYRVLRDRLNKAASFPYEKLRDGQKIMMREVIAAIRDTAKLFIVAPTGIGKTMATLYPSVKAQANGLTDQIFYLTPTRSQRKIAEKALNDLASEGFMVRSLTVRAKEQMCLSREHFCNTAQCPFAKNYYEHHRDALKESFRLSRILPEDVIGLGIKYHLCPFELSLEISAGCDVVICDYNYIFNPRVRLRYLLDDTKQRYTLLVDEAHNLARRSREMFSAPLRRSDLRRLLKAFRNFASRKYAAHHAFGVVDTGDLHSFKENAGKCVKAIERVLRDFDGIERILAAGDGGKPDRHERLSELLPYKPMVSDRFMATRVIPPPFMSGIEKLIAALSCFFNDSQSFEGREKMMVTYFDLLFFQRVSERYYDHTYITAWRLLEDDDLACSLLTLDASYHLTDIYKDKSPVVFFSATMTPASYYISLLDADSSAQHPELLSLDSPFDSARRLVLSYEAHSLRYRDRFLTLPSIASFIADVIRERTGHYLIFSPSFSYQNALADALKRINPPHARFMIQPPRMTEQQKNAFLDRFRKKGDSRSLAGLTVIGSLFNEGIDLIGEELTGVIVIGTGLPGLSPERDILRQYYEEKSNRGYEYAFMWPGFNRVTQAAGRLIRSEDDFGIVLLIDDRYGRPDYRRLLPEEWHTLHTSDREEALGAIREFWADFR